jgi:ABC-type uncharacterized transport system permease subunit
MKSAYKDLLVALLILSILAGLFISFLTTDPMVDQLVVGILIILVLSLYKLFEAPIK